jgi:Crp-like helix-turn-helix domain
MNVRGTRAGRTERPANHLLRRLNESDFAKIAGNLTKAHIDGDTVLYNPGDRVNVVYFPCSTSLASFVLSLEDGRDVDTLVVGREGAVGGIVNQGRLPAYSRMVVKLGGTFLSLEASKLEAAKQRSSALRELFASYADCLLAQLMQSIACNAAHSIEQRTARWITSAIERTGDDLVPLTHEQLSAMLGVGRSYTSRVIETFKAQRILETRRGALLIRDPAALRAKACRCNEEIERHFPEVFASYQD